MHNTTSFTVHKNNVSYRGRTPCPQQCTQQPLSKMNLARLRFYRAQANTTIIRLPERPWLSLLTPSQKVWRIFPQTAAVLSWVCS